MVVTPEAALIAVDSSVWIDRLRNRASAGVSKLDQILDDEVVIVGDIVLLEILQGATDELQSRKFQRMMARYQIVEMLDIRIAVQSAANFRLLRSKGVTIRKTPDLIIGTWCIENNCPLLHNDRDFLPMVQHLGLQEF